MFKPFLSNDFIKDIPPVSDSSKKILQETTITLDYPGAILADWETMLDLISKNDIEIRKKQGYFSPNLFSSHRNWQLIPDSGVTGNTVSEKSLAF
jgi:hypothetical protein